MNAKISVFVVCVEAIIYLLLYNLYDCIFYLARLHAAPIDFKKAFIYWTWATGLIITRSKIYDGACLPKYLLVSIC